MLLSVTSAVRFVVSSVTHAVSSSKAHIVNLLDVTTSTPSCLQYIIHSTVTTPFLFVCSGCSMKNVAPEKYLVLISSLFITQ